MKKTAGTQTRKHDETQKKIEYDEKKRNNNEE